jgi:hypothetical protein
MPTWFKHGYKLVLFVHQQWFHSLYLFIFGDLLFFFLFLFGNCSNKIQTLVKKNTTHYGGFVSCFEFSCFTTLHFSTILFGPQNLSYLCTLLFYLCTKNTIVSTIVYTPKFVTRKENLKQASLQLIRKPKVVLWYISFPFWLSCNFS